MKLALHFFTFILDILFPKSPLVFQIERLTAPQLYALAKKNIETSNIQSIFSYKDPFIQTGLWELKYRKNAQITKLFAQLLEESILADVDMLPTDSIIIPIPLSPKRYSQRGYNQCELLINQMTISYHKEYSALIRSKHTLSQTRLKRAQRLTNLKNCFAVSDKSKIAGKTIILIDDVSTTGATLKEAEKVLYKAGARDVKMYTVAR